MGGRDFDTDFLAILERLRSPISPMERNGIARQIQMLKVPAELSKEQLYSLFNDLYTSLHFTGIGETPEQKLKRFEDTRAFYRLLGLKLLRGRPVNTIAIPRNIYLLKIKEKKNAAENQALLAAFQKDAEETAKEFANSVLKGGRSRSRKGMRRSRKTRKQKRRVYYS